MDRSVSLQRLESRGAWDIIVIGGGATGLGAAVDAASRGHKTLLLEQHDFAKGTSSRSTKLVHGGVRYLRQGHLPLVFEALRERGIILRNAPHLAHDQPFVIPIYSRWDGLFYGIGMKIYDLMSGKLSLGASRSLSREETLRRIPTVASEDLRGGVIYHDGQFDDARLAINLAQTFSDLGGTPINYVEIVGLLKNEGRIKGVRALDRETGREYEIAGRAVINATGIFTDRIMHLDDPAAKPRIAMSRGAHLVVDRKFLPGDSAIMVPHTDDGRVLFAVPWHDKVILGTTDTPAPEASLEPRASREEIEFILHHAARYLAQPPKREDVLSVYAGLRPLVKSTGKQRTAAISRDHFLFISHAGLVTITGGKWTTYRKMGETAVNHAAIVGGLESRPSKTETLRIHGWNENADTHDPLKIYGSDADAVRALMNEQPALREKIHLRLPYTGAEVIWAARKEMARTVEDILARRTRALLLDAQASIEAAPLVAGLLADELGRDAGWQQKQAVEYTNVAQQYLLKPANLV
ncbi:MAG TPA: glycerol-3-phosphate dehydrogenase/oxidase [Verrucomicrobiae bacterium]|nr:glycerol-3-phosphate dehydrogenase/oxidase [Verrucomicrobiae bacterium]